MLSPVEQVTDDGYDMQFGTNVIGNILEIHFECVLKPSSFPRSFPVYRITCARSSGREGDLA